MLSNPYAGIFLPPLHFNRHRKCSYFSRFDCYRFKYFSCHQIFKI
nr:MAG TPA: hypothetical protein [Caudoviricetes sp.]